MNVALISSNPSFHSLAKRLASEIKTGSVYHFGASDRVELSENYYPVRLNIPHHGWFDDIEIKNLTDALLSYNIDLVFSCNLIICSNLKFFNKLISHGIRCFSPHPSFYDFEKDQLKTRNFLSDIDVPTISGKKFTGYELYQKFFHISRPFRITTKDCVDGTIVDDSNFNTIFENLFSYCIDFKPRFTNLGFDSQVILDHCGELKLEYSYIALVNERDCKYIGCVKNYKNALELDDRDMAALNLKEFNPVIHEYMEKIFKNFKTQINKKYKGFITLKVGIQDNDIPVILGFNIGIKDTDLSIIIEIIDNNILDLLVATEANHAIPDIKRNSKCVICLKILNKNKNRLQPTYYTPNLISDDSINIYLDGNNVSKQCYASVISKYDTFEESYIKLNTYLSNQSLRGFYYLKDVVKN